MNVPLGSQCAIFTGAFRGLACLFSAMPFCDQCHFDIRCEWGQHGVDVLARNSEAVIIADVFSFSTAVDVAVARGATIFPYRWKDESAVEYAKSLRADLVDVTRTKERWSLSPASLASVPAGARLVLPSANGATLSLSTGAVPTLAGCFRNAKAVAETAQLLGKSIAVIPAGERWPDGSLRPAVEDWLAAGAIIHYLNGTRSPEAASAIAAFSNSCSSLTECLRRCSSGRELLERGFESDISYAADLNISSIAPILRNEQASLPLCVAYSAAL